MGKYPNLLSPIQVGGLTFRTHTIQSGMVSNLNNEDGSLADREIAYQVFRAKNNIGLQLVGASYIEQRAKGYRYQLGIESDERIPDFRKLTDAVHAAGGNIGIQIWHGGSSADPTLSGMELVSCSPIPTQTGQIPHELTVDEIKEIVVKFADAAERAQKAGFDMVEIHGSHGYLLDQFYSPSTNLRTDEYGGSLENRCRFPVEVAKAVRERVGKDYLVSFRITSDEFNGNPDRNSVQEAIYLANRLVDEAGIQLFNVSCGGISTSATSDMPEALLADLAAGIKAALAGKAVVSVADRIKRPEVAEGVLASGKSDLVTMGRATICDPEILTKAAEGREEDIRICASCNYCLATMFSGNRAACMQNPLMGHEGEYHLDEAADKSKKVIVAGGGPAGLQAAIVCAKRGHDVTLMEASDVLGGKVNIAIKPPVKFELENVIKSLSREAEKVGVKFCFNTAATKENILAAQPDAVIVATGSVPVRPNLPGMDQDNIVFAKDILLGNVEAGKNVVIIGGGTVGVETADYLLAKGHRVTIVEMNPAVMMDLMFLQQVPYMMRVFPRISGMLTNNKVLAVKGSDVVTSSRTIKLVDTVVLAAGFKSENQLADDLKGTGIEVAVVGDAITPGKIFEATHTAMAAAYAV